MRNAKYKGKTTLNAKYIVEEEQLQILHFRGADSKYTEIFEVAQITSVDNSAFKCYLFDLFHLKSFVQHLDSQAQKSQR